MYFSIHLHFSLCQSVSHFCTFFAFFNTFSFFKLFFTFAIHLYVFQNCLSYFDIFLTVFHFSIHFPCFEKCVSVFQSIFTFEKLFFIFVDPFSLKDKLFFIISENCFALLENCFFIFFFETLFSSFLNPLSFFELSFCSIHFLLEENCCHFTDPFAFFRETVSHVFENFLSVEIFRSPKKTEHPQTHLTVHVFHRTT